MSHFEVENASVTGAFSFVVSYWASYSLTGNTAGIAPSFFAVQQQRAKEGETKMKKLMTVVSLCVVILGIVGCGNDTEGWYPISGKKAHRPPRRSSGNDTEGWYPISGGYINLRNVHLITTEIDVWGLHDSPITRESIAQLKKHVAEKYEEALKYLNGRHMIYKACIKFDDFTVNLPTEAKSKKEVLRLLDSYLDMVEDLKLPVK